MSEYTSPHTSTETALEVVILAAGQGSRMRSKWPKVLHPIAGRSMLGYAVLRAQELGAHNIVVVTGHGADKVEAQFAEGEVRFARQDKQLGTAHAFKQAVPQLQGGDVLVLYGDTPLISLDTLQAMQAYHRAKGAGITILTGELPDASGYGRIVRDENGQVQSIVEEKSASPVQKQIREFNSGVYLMDARASELVARIDNNNIAQEYYLTDILALYRAEGASVEAFKIADAGELMGANDRVQLAEATHIMRHRINTRHMRAGVTFIDPTSTYIEDTVQIGQDTVLEAGVVLKGNTVIAEDAFIGAYSVIQDSQIAAHAVIHSHSVLEGANVHSEASVGPFARLRTGTVLEQHVHVGNFVEIKNSTLHAGVKAGHLAYLGDADIGREVNIGAGTITANFNGVNKFRTFIGDGAFIGSNSVLIAPIHIGRAAIVAAGSVITSAVAEGELGVARGHQRNVENYARRFWSQNQEWISDKLPVICAWLKE